jgi:hypothetical protein
MVGQMGEFSMTTRICAAAILLLAAAPAMAQTGGEGRFSAGISAGTLGVGPEVGFRTRKIGVRANANFLSVSQGFDTDDIDFDGKVKLRSGGIMLDFFPGGGGFHISAGGRINGNKARVVATPTSPTQIGGTTFTPAQIGTLTGRADVKNFAPALTIGYSGKLRKGFVVGVEAGALFQGRVRIRRFMSSTGLIPVAQLEAERQDLQDDVDKYKVYPILQFKAGYRF